MRRGLMGWNAEELPVATLEARLARLREEMDGAGMDAYIVYTNNVRPSAVTHITGFTPYWSDALLLVPMSGAPVFATALSKRVSEWIRTTDPISEIVNSPRPGTLVGERLAQDSAIRRVGVLEYDTLPAGLADDLAAAAPAIEWLDGSALFTGLRRTIDDAERGLLMRADAIATAALNEAAAGKAENAGTLAGLIEQHARLAGAEEAYIAIAPDLAADRRFNRMSKPLPLAERFAARASIAYKGAWVRRARTFAKDNSVAKAEAWLDGIARSLEAGKPVAAQLAARVNELPGASRQSWMAESCTGSYPLSVIDSSHAPGKDLPTNGQFLVLTIELTLDGVPWLGAVPLIVGKPGF
jgi:Creatinase/Prolidase N-terminal domain